MFKMFCVGQGVPRVYVLKWQMGNIAGSILCDNKKCCDITNSSTGIIYIN